MVSILELEKLQKEAEETEKTSQAATKAYEDAKKAFDAVKNTPEIVIRLAIIKKLEEDRDEAARREEDLRDADDVRIMYNKFIIALKRDSGESIEATILSTVIRVARNTRTQ